MLLNYKCTCCLFTREMKYLPREYLLSEIHRVPMAQRHFWCTSCNDISVAEVLERDDEEVEYLEGVLAESRALVELDLDPSSLSLKEAIRVKSAPETIREVEEKLANWAEWRARRKAPGKCLRCGCISISVPDSYMSSFAHGGCSGVLECLCTVWSSNSPATFPHVYSVDGDFLEQGRKPVFRGGLKVVYEPMELFV
ncbi:hypothetical protein QYE80_26485 [Pseudomonas tohonis]|nr:hypothetical protein [Pseudomonas tohonis]